MNKNYDDIIHLPHPVSKKHKQMSLYDRAAQFAPFAALTGHDEAIKETARVVDEKLELTEDQQAHLNECITILQKEIKNQPEVTICYYVADDKKEGGCYLNHTGKLRIIDPVNQFVEFVDKKRIAFVDIYQMIYPIEKAG